MTVAVRVYVIHSLVCAPVMLKHKEAAANTRNAPTIAMVKEAAIRPVGSALALTVIVVRAAQRIRDAALSLPIGGNHSTDQVGPSAQAPLS